MKKTLLAIGFLLCTLVAASTIQAAMISVIPSADPVAPGAFTVDIIADEMPTTRGGTLDIAWDPSIITMNGVPADVALAIPPWEAGFSDPGTLDSAAGTLSGLRVGSFAGATDGDGLGGAILPIATLTFTAISPGTSFLNLQVGAPNSWLDLAGGAIPVDYQAGSVTVIPEPASLVLMMSGLAGLMALRRRRG